MKSTIILCTVPLSIVLRCAVLCFFFTVLNVFDSVDSSSIDEDI